MLDESDGLKLGVWTFRLVGGIRHLRTGLGRFAVWIGARNCRMASADSRMSKAARRLLFSAGGLLLVAFCLLLSRDLFAGNRSFPNSFPPPLVVQIDLNDVVEPVSEEYVVRGIREANRVNAQAILLQLSTPGGLETSMRAIVQAIISSRVPVITYVAPSGSRAASAGFFILLSGDVAAMAPGTNTGAAHPVVLGGSEIGKTMETKIENDAAAYMRSVAGKRQRNVKLAEEGVRESKSYAEKEALDGHLIDVIANSPHDLFAQLNGKTIQRFDGTTTTLQLANAVVQPYSMTTRERFLSWIADPNIAFILGVLGMLCLYVEFTHPGMVLPGVVGAIAIVLALFAFHMLPINSTGVILILLAFVLFALEVKVNSHGVLAAGGAVAMIVGSLILVDSPWPGVRIRLATALSVTVPVTVIAVILLRVALAARRSKAITGEAGIIDALGVAQTDIEPEGKVLVQGTLWTARSPEKIIKGSRVRVRDIQGLTLVVEAMPESR